MNVFTNAAIYEIKPNFQMFDEAIKEIVEDNPDFDPWEQEAKVTEQDYKYHMVKMVHLMNANKLCDETLIRPGFNWKNIKKYAMLKPHSFFGRTLNIESLHLSDQTRISCMHEEWTD